MELSDLNEGVSVTMHDGWTWTPPARLMIEKSGPKNPCAPPYSVCTKGVTRTLDASGSLAGQPFRAYGFTLDSVTPGQSSVRNGYAGR
jgi:hypothetical protein